MEIHNDTSLKSGIRNKKNKKKEIEGTYEKVLTQVNSGKIFRFTSGRKSPSGLSIKKNIHYDNRSKKTLTTWLGDSKSRVLCRCSLYSQGQKFH